MASRPCVLIAATSGRALAASARRAGYLPLVADCYGDLDTRTLAHRFVRLARDRDGGVAEQGLGAALVALSGHRRPIGLVYGSGFESRPELLRLIASRWRLLGNDATTVERLKNPLLFAQLCAASCVPHPETTLIPPHSGDWLCKRRGGSGGTHIRPLAANDKADPALYFQRRVAGENVSLLFLAGGHWVEIVGFSRQWQTPCRDQPYRYGGAVKPAGLTLSAESTLSDAIRRLLQQIPLRGINSADFLVTRGDYMLLEINPRAGATLDIYEPDTGLFDQHVAACVAARSSIRRQAGGRAAAIVYATRDIDRLALNRWPDWSADHQTGRVAAGDPLCTVIAAGSDANEARKLLDFQAAQMLRWAQGDIG